MFYGGNALQHSGIVKCLHAQKDGGVGRRCPLLKGHKVCPLFHVAIHGHAVATPLGDFARVCVHHGHAAASASQADPGGNSNSSSAKDVYGVVHVRTSNGMRATLVHGSWFMVHVTKCVRSGGDLPP